MNRLRGGEEGFTLVEMMVTIVIMLTVFFALHAVFETSMRIFGFSNNKVEAVENARVGMERMVRELRMAYPYGKASSPPDERLLSTMGETQITFGNDLDGDRRVEISDEQISYFLDGRRLMRRAGDGLAQPVAEGVSGLRIEYLKNSGGTLVTATTESEVETVRISLEVRVNRGGEPGTQTLIYQVGLKNR
ncbi:Type IV minor pilin PilW [Rubrobacter xylanophilus DSM 9941]|uniref:PilW family protein n=1 Tax=Rubrobacter xylanophilus TaxID=49319 RepID=UPI001C6409AA|nr:prepilin-type N-terminal cleavage/methylation domain-containing protein [Rubrobacter xylanophilus]QYJ14400.1 Type IV minor pilin PilW [Rubrobacter xylanophilus DSM 9941]